MRVVALFVGKPGPVTVVGVTFRTAGAKLSVDSAVLRLGGFDGDRSQLVGIGDLR
jgi:hypothetical protein